MSPPSVLKTEAANASYSFQLPETNPVCSEAIEAPPSTDFFCPLPAEPKPAPAFQNQYSFRLFAPTCVLWTDASAAAESLALEDIRVDQTVALASFDAQDATQTCMAQQLGSFLEGLQFDTINRKLHGADYGQKPIFDSELGPAQIRERFAALPEFDAKQRNALLFFMYGEALKAEELTSLFAGQAELFAALQAQNLIVGETAGAETVYRLNGLSLTSQRLPNHSTIYLFNDIPARLNPHAAGEPTAQISGTSYFLLNRLMGDYQQGVPRAGVMADFGAGTGIQALTLLKMYPGITRALSLEIDGHSMNLNRLNAMLNGVADRVEVVDNSRIENLQDALAGQELDFAVSNPPFNVVPKEYENSFTHFGYGGDHGIDITQIFLDQALPLLKKNGEFLYYSFLASDAKGDYFVTRYLQDHFKGLALHYEDLDAGGYRYFKLPEYAQAIASFMLEHGLWSEGPMDEAALAQDIEKKLQERGVYRLEEKIGRIVKRGDSNPVSVVQYTPSAVLKPLPLFDARNLGGERYTKLGGVFETIHQLPQIQGGERIERRGGVYLQHHFQGDVGKKLQELLKDPDYRKKLCKGDPECEKLFSDSKLIKQ